MNRGAAAALGALAALAPILALRGFTVDDALISARYAAHIAQGLGYRFNPTGLATDGVTPLGWPYLLAPFASGGPLAALAAAKLLGAITWTIAAAILAIAGDRLIASAEPGPRRSAARIAPLLLITASAPLGAWSVAGMETGLIISLAALAVALRQMNRPLAGTALAGLAAALRPEMIPWSCVFAASPSPGARWELTHRTTAARLALGLLPAVAVASFRAMVFGRAAPLSVFAKPSTVDLGAKYALACFLLTGPIAIVAPLAFRRLDGFARGLVLSVAAHFVAVAVAGGDWMPLSRLVTPVLPAAALATAHIVLVADLRATALRLALALGGEIFQAVRAGPSAASVGADRMRLIEELRAPLHEAHVVAALDIGWVGAATPATIVDIAGLTDPAIAALPGGHTSKAIPVGLLDARRVDTIVLLLKEGETLTEPWSDSFFARIVELRIASIPHLGESFSVVAESHVPHLHYVVVRRTQALAMAGTAPSRCPQKRSSPP